jgi:hypothetical protein
VKKHIEESFKNKEVLSKYASQVNDLTIEKDNISQKHSELA